jgi:hypothetical protein
MPFDASALTHSTTLKTKVVLSVEPQKTPERMLGAANLKMTSFYSPLNGPYFLREFEQYSTLPKYRVVAHAIQFHEERLQDIRRKMWQDRRLRSSLLVELIHYAMENLELDPDIRIFSTMPYKLNDDAYCTVLRTEEGERYIGPYWWGAKAVQEKDFFLGIEYP